MRTDNMQEINAEEVTDLRKDLRCFDCEERLLRVDGPKAARAVHGLNDGSLHPHVAQGVQERVQHRVGVAQDHQNCAVHKRKHVNNNLFLPPPQNKTKKQQQKTKQQQQTKIKINKKIKTPKQSN